MEPWLASGEPATPVRSSRPDLTALVLTAERSRLIVPVRWSAGLAPHASEPVSLVLPGVPESCVAYLLTMAGPQRLETRRVTGGLRVLVDRLPDDGFVLLTEDGYAFSQVEGYLRRYGERAAQVRLELAVLARQQAAGAVAGAPSSMLQTSDAAGALARADAEFTAIARPLETHDAAEAYGRAAAADALLADLQQQLLGAIWPHERLGTPPLPVDWSTLPDLARLAGAVTRAPRRGGRCQAATSKSWQGWSTTDGSAARAPPLASPRPSG